MQRGTDFKKTAWVAAIVVAGALGLIYLKSARRKAHEPAAPSSASSPATSDRNAPAVGRGADPSRPTAKSTAAPPSVTLRASERLGLCQYESVSKEALLSLASVKRLNLSSRPAKYLALPEQSGRCWAERAGSVRARVVDYDRGADQAYEHYGDIEVRLQLESRFENLQEFAVKNKATLAEMSAASFRDVANAVLNDGGDAQSAVYLFRVLEAQWPKPRRPVGSYSFYPGVRLIGAEEARSLKAGSKVALVRAHPWAKVPSLIEKALEPTARPWAWKLIASPTSNSVLAREASLNALPRDKELALVGEDASDRAPYNLASALWSAGFRKIAVVAEGLAALGGHRLATPDAASGLSPVGLDVLAASADRFEIVDCRAERFENRTLLKGALLAPVYFFLPPETWMSDFTNYHSKRHFSAPYELNRRLKLRAIAETGAKKPLLLIGRDEYDWGPVLLMEALKFRGLSTASWYRAGFEDLQVRRVLGVLDGRIEARLQPFRSSVTREAKNSPFLVSEPVAARALSFERRPPKKSSGSSRPRPSAATTSAAPSAEPSPSPSRPPGSPQRPPSR